MEEQSATTASPAVEEDALPRWDLSVLFPGLSSPEFACAFTALTAEIDELGVHFDRLGIDADSVGSGAESIPVRERLEQALTGLNALDERLESMMAYLHGHVTTNSRDDLAQARLSELQARVVRLSTLQTRFNAWLGTLPIEAIIARSPLAAAHAFALRKLHASARHLMSPAEEALAVELAPSSGDAWAKLHGNLTSQITVDVEINGETHRMPMSAIRNLAMEPDPSLRQKAWQAELAGWEAHALPIAAALNGVKGQVLTLSARRHWDDPLDESLFWAGIDREILDALLVAGQQALPDFRRYLQRKARALGVSELGWCDLFAPVGSADRDWRWPQAAEFIERNFATFSEPMAGLARRAFSENWIDAGPRPGKVGGAYCMWLADGQSRILGNYSASYDGVTMLAHELGHAYHNLNETGLTPLQRRKPMILAETASTFCETLVKEVALTEAEGQERLYILEQSLQGACQIVVDILSRFQFEQALFAARRERELSVTELCELMRAAQEATYGDGLGAGARHPYMWAVKGHYYSPDRSYYNFPYLFGMLFGLGLYAAYQEEPNGFPDRYDALLASTGQAGAADLANGFGIDLRSPAFWQASLDVVRSDIEQFAELVEG